VTTRHFSREEVDGLIPELTRLMGRAMEQHRAAAAIKEALEREQAHLRAVGGGLIDRRAWAERTRRLERLATDVGEGLAAIARLGGVTKDLALGLVDFPGLVPEARGAETVNLCWRFGESAVRFWHGLDEGYAHRKPLP
jgi:hypothetical protein